MGAQMSQEPASSSAVSQGKGLSAGLWTVQTILALMFMFSGVMKFVMPAEQMTKGTSLPLWFFHFIGVCEVLGGLGLILPAVLRIAPVLTPIAASCLAVIMVGAVVISLPMGAVAALPAVFGVLCIFVAYGRFRLRPIAPKS
jgi:uncharacterized membrane protein YphA (DoxX/SURF4 family)